MKYVAVKGADKILSKSTYIVQRPDTLKNNWKEEFGNNNPIMLELGMGRGDMIIKMAQQNPKINYIGLELDDNQYLMNENFFEKELYIKISKSCNDLIFIKYPNLEVKIIKTDFYNTVLELI